MSGNTPLKRDPAPQTIFDVAQAWIFDIVAVTFVMTDFAFQGVRSLLTVPLILIASAEGLLH